MCEMRSARADRRRWAARSGRGTTTRSRRSARARARRAPPSRPWPPGSGPRHRCSRHAARSAGSCLDHELDVVQAARFMAMISVTYADALIACFDAKYHYAFWRPITAIRAGDTDGNAATVGDPAWTPRAPRHAEPSGVPERALLHHPGRGTGHRRLPGDTAHRLHRPQPDRPRRPALRDARATSSTRSATPASGAASTTARRSRTAARSRRRPPTMYWPTTSIPSPTNTTVIAGPATTSPRHTARLGSRELGLPAPTRATARSPGSRERRPGGGTGRDHGLAGRGTDAATRGISRIALTEMIQVLRNDVKETHGIGSRIRPSPNAGRRGGFFPERPWAVPFSVLLAVRCDFADR